MLRVALLGCLALCVMAASAVGANPLRGKYVEARTCQVYTGPCFANGESGSTGKDAVMTWNVESGDFAGVDLAGLSVAVIVKASHTLGFQGFDNATTKEAIVIIDEAANEQQSAALESFALGQTGLNTTQLAASHRANIDMQFNMRELTAEVSVGDFAHLKTRKARPGDCICSNESAYYPPLTALNQFVPGVTIEGDVKARKLGTRWSIPDSRTAYLGTFEHIATTEQIAKKL